MKMTGEFTNKYEYFKAILETTSEDKLAPKLKILKANISKKKPKMKTEIFKDNITPKKKETKSVAKPKDKPVPKGSHKMPDGSIMKDKDMKSKPSPEKKDSNNEKDLKYLQKITLKFIEDHKAWLLPVKKSGADNGYEYYMNMFNKDIKSISKLKILIYFIEDHVEKFKTGTNAGGIINPFNKKNKPVLKMPKESYELYQKIKNL